MKYIYITVLILVTFFSCKEKAIEPVALKEGAAAVTIAHSAGDLWSASDEFLPLPANVATFNGKEVFVISNRKEVGSQMHIVPIGAITLIENDSLKTVVMAIPNDEKERAISVDDFDEFSTIHSSAKWILEQYLVNRLGTNKTQVKSWENEKYAINYLLKQS